VTATGALSAPEAFAASERAVHVRRRGGRRALMRRHLVAADIAGLTLAFIGSVLAFGLSAPGDHVRPAYELAVFFLSLPVWLLLASVHGLYRADERRLGHSTVDDLVGVIHLVTLGAWIFFIGCWATRISSPRPIKLLGFWVLATLLVTGCRALARSLCVRSPAYTQNTIIVGGGEIGQLIARKLGQHPEYGIRLLGIVDAAPRERRADLAGVGVLGAVDQLPSIVAALGIERVIVSFSNASDAYTAEVVRRLRPLDVQVDVVPRLYELLGTQVDVHAVEGLPLIGLPAARWSSWAARLKRAIDVVGAGSALILLAPLFAFIAWKVRRSSPGPIFFRQTRLGLGMEAFTALKFRTMWVGTNDDEHRAYIAETMSASAPVGANGTYKLDRDKDVTPFGRWLRKTSLDELPQLLNVLRGEMSLVGPRPCIPYETERFKPQHFERFLLPQGITGLWQVTARAHATFGEALDMDIAYVRSWSLGLDLRLLFRTPLQLLRGEGTA
jgi:exopolysaccharide biosynthesis polyprenyl glycosylphosphotransferase